MIDVSKKTDYELNNIAYEAIKKEIGISGLLRFIQMHDRGYGDYTKERENVQKSYTVDSLANEIIKSRK